MTIRYKFWALALTFSMLAAPAMADDTEGAYVFITAGMSKMQNGCQSGWVTTTLPANAIGPVATCNENHAVFRAGVGYQYTPMWGLEASYGQFGSANSNGFTSLGGTPSSYEWQIKALGLAVQAVATMHMSEALSVFGKFGVASVDFDESLHTWNPNVPATVSYTEWYPVVQTAKIAPALGAGVKYDVSPHGSVFVIGEYFGTHSIYDMYGTGSKVRLLSASVGLMYKY